MPSTIEIFCCYAREDRPMLNDLRKHLKPLERQGLIKLWSDTDLNAGDAWEKVLHLHLESADIILLLISPDFMYSDYCYSVEMTRALERHEAGQASVIPVLLRSTFWKGAPFAKIQALPTDGRPVQTWARADDAYTAITENICVVVEKITEQKAARAKQIQDYLQKAEALFAENNSSEDALALYEVILLLEPDNATAWLGTAKIFYNLQKHPECLEALVQLEHIDPAALDAEVYLRKSYVLTRLQRHDEALAAVEQSLSLKQDDMAYRLKGDILYELQQYPQALEAYQQAIKLEPDELEYYVRACELLFRLRRFDEALTACVSALYLSLDNASYYDLHGRILLKLHQPEKALASYEQAIDLLKESKSVESFQLGLTDEETWLPASYFYEQKGQICLQLQNYEEALTAFEKAIDKAEKNQHDLHAGKGQALAGLGRYDEAIESLQTAIKLSAPYSDPQFYHDLGLAYDALARSAYEMENERRTVWQPEQRDVFLVPARPVFDPTKVVLLRTLTGHTDEVNSVAINRDGTLLASASDDNTIKLWALPAGREFRTLTGHTGAVWGIDISPDGKILVSVSGDDEMIKLWELPSGREFRTLTGHTGAVSGFTFSPDGKVLVSASDDNTIKFWELPSGREFRTLTGRTGDVRGLDISPDGKVLAITSDDNTIKLWEFLSGREFRTFTDHTGVVLGIAISPDGKILASGNGSTIKIWELPSGRELRTLAGHTDAIRGIAISPDGKVLVSASDDNTIKLWELPSGHELNTLDAHTNPVYEVVFSSDGTLLASASADGTIKLWGMPE